MKYSVFSLVRILMSFILCPFSYDVILSSDTHKHIILSSVFSVLNTKKMFVLYVCFPPTITEYYLIY